MSDDAPSTDSTALSPVGLPQADSGFDLSLRLLTALVVVALAASVGLLVYRWVAPRLDQANTGPVRARASEPAPAAASPEVGPRHGDEVLMDPGRVFRCEEQGRVTFSDQACVGGSPAAPPAAPSRAPGAGAPDHNAPASH
jgi:hypothetical protein